jgi:chromosome segregation ATPase
MASALSSALRSGDVDENVSFIKVTLCVSSVEAATPGEYYLKWDGIGKSKKTKVCTVVTGPTAVSFSMSLYAKAMRDPSSNDIVSASDDPRDSLKTTLYLVRSDETVWGGADIDVGEYLTAGRGEIVLDMKSGSRVTYDLTAKSMGDSKELGLPVSRLSSCDKGGKYTGTGAVAAAVAAANSGAAFGLRNENNFGSTSVPSTIAVGTAAKLEQLRQDVDRKATQLDSLKAQTAQIDEALQAKAVTAAGTSQPGNRSSPVPTGSHLTPLASIPFSDARLPTTTSAASETSSAAALAVRVRALEEEKAVVERERNEAERKVQAHVQHALKIKDTYNQLAAWYNNLRHEHAELQKRHPESTTEASRELPTATVATTHADDAKHMEQELDDMAKALAAERNEKKELLASHTAVLEEKASALAASKGKCSRLETELANAILSAKASKAELELSHKESLRANEVTEVCDARENEIVSLRSELAEANLKLTLQNDAVASSLKEALGVSAMEVAEMEQKVRDSVIELTALRAELSKAQAALAEAQCGSNRAEDVSKELDSLRSASEESLREVCGERDRLQEEVTKWKSTVDELSESVEAKEVQMDEIQRAAENLRVELDATLEQLERERGEASAGRHETSASSESEEVIADLTAKRDHAIRELFRVRKAMNAELKALRKEHDALTTRSRELEGRSTTAASAQGEAAAGSVETKERLAALEAEKNELMSAKEEALSSADAVVATRGVTSAEHAEVKEKLAALEVEKVKLESAHREASSIAEASALSLASTLKELGEVKERSVVLAAEKARLETVVAERESALVHASQKHAQECLTLRSESEAASLELSARVVALEGELKGKSDALNLSADGTEKELQFVRDELERARTDLEKARVEVVVNAERVASKQAEADGSSLAREEASRELSFLSTRREQEVTQLNAELTALRLQLSDVTGARRERDVELSQIQIALDDLRATCTAAEAARDAKIVEASGLSGELASLKESMKAASESSSSADKQLADVQRSLAEAVAERDAVASKIAVLKASLSSENSSRVKLEKETALLRSRVEELSASIGTMEAKLVSANKVLSEQNLKKADVDNEVVRLTAALTATERTRDAWSAELAEARSLQDEKESARKATERELAVANRRVHELTASLSEALEMRAVEVAAKEAEVKRLADQVHALESEAMATGAAATKAASSATSQFQSMQRQVEVLENELTASKRSVTKLEEVYAAKAKDSEFRLLSLKQELKDMHEAAVTKQEEFEKSRSLLRDFQNDHSQLVSEFDELEERYKSLKLSLDGAQMRRSSLEARESALEADKNALALTVRSLEEDMEKSLKEKREALSRVEELERIVKNEKEERRTFGEVRAEMREARGRAERLEAELQVLKTENKTLGTRMEAMSKLDEGADGLVDELIRCKMDLANAWEQIDSYKRRVKQLDPALQVSPNLSGAGSGGSFERRS